MDIDVTDPTAGAVDAVSPTAAAAQRAVRGLLKTHKDFKHLRSAKGCIAAAIMADPAAARSWQAPHVQDLLLHALLNLEVQLPQRAIMKEDAVIQLMRISNSMVQHECKRSVLSPCCA